jgi:hypothetical protein
MSDQCLKLLNRVFPFVHTGIKTTGNAQFPRCFIQRSGSTAMYDFSTVDVSAGVQR